VKTHFLALSRLMSFYQKESPKLPDPSPGLKLSRVVLGRGTQNYT
jgi:hypothetical protein